MTLHEIRSMIEVEDRLERFATRTARSIVCGEAHLAEQAKRCWRRRLGIWMRRSRSSHHARNFGERLAGAPATQATVTRIERERAYACQINMKENVDSIGNEFGLAAVGAQLQHADHCPAGFDQRLHSSLLQAMWIHAGVHGGTDGVVLMAGSLADRFGEEALYLGDGAVLPSSHWHPASLPGRRYSLCCGFSRHRRGDGHGETVRRSSLMRFRANSLGTRARRQYYGCGRRPNYRPVLGAADDGLRLAVDVLVQCAVRRARSLLGSGRWE